MNWGIISTGAIAKKFATTINAMNSEGEKLIAVSSRDEKKARAFADAYGIKRSYGSYEAMLLDKDIDAIYIATPNNLHYENTLMCLNKGKHVLCEKPFTTCAEDAIKLYKLADEKGLFLMEAFWIKFLPIHEKLIEIVKSNQYGKLIHARCDYGFIADGDRRKRKLASELGGGALLDIGIYNLGFLYMMMGTNPISFTSEVRINEFGTDEFSILQLRYANGCTAHSLQTIGMQIERHGALYFENATIYLQDFQRPESMVIKTNAGETIQIDSPFDINGFEYQIREVNRCVKQGKTHSDIFSPEDSIATLKLMDEIRKSWNMKFSFEEEFK